MTTVAIVTALAGTVALGLTAAGVLADGTATSSAGLQGLALHLESFELVSDHHDQTRHDHSQGFQMPTAMMPGTPERGRRRVHVELKLTNEGRSPRSLGAHEFTLRSRGELWPATDRSHAGRALYPEHVVWLDLYFDVPDGDAPLELVWRRGGEAEVLALDMAPSDHEHSDHEH